MPVALKGTNSPLFCIYGDPTLLAAKLKKKRPIYSLNTAYCEVDLAAAPATINKAVCIYIAAIRAKQATGPYFLYGHCSGATIAYEIARQLIADGDDVSQLYLLEPAFNAVGMKDSAVMMMKDVQSNGFNLAGLKSLLSVSLKLLMLLPEVAYYKLRLFLHSVLGTMADIQLRFDSHLRKIVPSVRSYVYQELDCDVSFIYRNLDDAQIGELEKFWGNVTRHEVKVYSVEAGAGHLAVLEPVQLETVAAVIDQSIN